MSWAADDWTSGLSGRVLQKVQELQAQQERLNREKQQKQLQLDNVEAALHKQKLKNEELRVDLVAVQRELVAVQEQAQGEVRARERLTQELQMKQAQVCGLEGQLDSARTLTQTLTQEIKRLEAELEKLQKGNGSGDSVLFSTPCWNMTSPWDNGSRPDERPGLRGDGDMKAHSVRQQLQFGDLSPKSSVGSTSSPLPQQPHKTPPLTRHVRQSETPSGVFPWERDNSVSAPKGRVTSSGPSCNVIVRGSDSGDYGMEEALRKERDTVQELRKWAESLEGELRAEKQRCKECEARLAEVKREVNTKEQSLTRSRDELSRAQTRIAQEGDRAEAAEQRVKQLQEELKCQRQNAETSRCNAEQRRKEMEREHNKELLELQKERQASERQHQQESNKLNQEIQQARAQHNTLQSQYDKLSLQKQAVERDLETAKGKLKGVETDLSETRKREAQTQAKLTEAQRENEGLSVRLEQLKKKEKNLEEEVKRLTEELAEALRLIKELQDKLAASAAAAAAAPLHATAAAESFCPAITIIQERSPPHRPCTQRKKLHKTERAREEGQERMKYPSNREPGEGIDSEHIAEFGSEDSKDQKIRGNKKSQCEPGRQSETDMETSLTEQDTGIEDTDTESYMSDSTSDTAHKPDGDYICGSRTGGDQDSSKNISSHPGSGQKNNSSSPDNLKRENTALRDELQDVKQELQRRLDDLETQRRAEAEARTKLKQLSRKHSNQAEQHRTKAQELREAAGKLEAQLEEERKEGGKLRQTLALLEKELQTLKEEKERIKERDDENEEKERSRLEQALADMERKQLEMEEESGQLKRDLEALQSELAQVREEREKERDLERKQPQKEELKAELDLRAKIQELQAELDKLRESSHSKEKDLKDNAPLTYLQLGDLDTKNNATVISEGIIPSPDAHMAFCESVNQQNAIVSQEVMTSDLITDFTEYAGKITHGVSSVEDKEGSPPNIKTLSDLDKTAFLLKELERVRMEKEGEAEAARNTQKKLEALQKQVTSQTKQLTQAFESQTKHIQNLLTELQERESALLKQNKELDLCREEIASLKAEKQLWQKELNVTASVNPEQSVDVSERSSCDIVEANSSVQVCEKFQMQTARTVTDGLQHTDQLMLSSTSSKGQDEHKNTNDDTVQNSDPDSCVSNEHKSVTSSEALGTRDALPVENTTAKDLVRSCVTIQQSTGKVTDNTAEQISGTSSDANTDKHVEQPDVKEFQHVPPENLISPDAIALKRVTEELLEAQNELIVLRTENEKLTLKLNEMCEEELQSVRQENELLKSKLKAMETESHPVQEPVPTENSASSHLTPEYEDPSSIKPDDNRDGATLGREELQTAPESDPDKSTPEVQHESFSSAQIHCLQEQVQSMQAQIQSLAEENKRQVEELEFWRQTDLSPGETVDHHGDSGTIVLVREDQLLLSCSSNRILAQNRDTRTMVIHQSGPTEPNHLSSTQPVPDDQQKLCGACGHSNKSSGSTQEVVAQDSCKTTKVNISPKIDTMTVNNNNDAQPGVLDTDVAGGNSENSFRDSQLKTKSTEQADKDELQTALVIPEPETKANADSRQNNQQDTSQNVSGATERKAKVIDANQNNVLSETDDPQKSDLSGQEPEWKGTADLAQDRDDGEKTTPLQNDTAKVNKGESFVPAEGDRNWAPVQSAEVLESPGGRCLEGKDLREMRSLGTQTEEWEGENRGSAHIPREGQTLLHVSTQTEAEDPEKPRQEEEEEDGEEEAADSPPLSPALVTDAEKLLFSGSFPIPADPVHLAERIRRSRTRMSAAYDDTEYEPYGLPEVVMKGFADIPSGPACPYVLRRGLLGTEAVPLPLREQKEEEEKEQDP